MPAMIDRLCKCGCGIKFKARAADVKRGWGLFSDKSCKARWQERRTGQYRAYLDGQGVSHSDKLSLTYDTPNLEVHTLNKDW